MRIENFSQLLGVVTWMSFILLSWLLVLRAVPPDLVSIIFMMIFFVIAFFTSALNMKKRIA